MQTQDIRQLAEWLAATDIDLLELQGPNLQIEIHRDGSAPEQQAAPTSNAAVSADHVSVRAGSLGVLLDHIPGRNTPLCTPGSTVQAGGLIALMQVGLLLLPVRAPCDGWTGDWHVPPGSTLGYGTPLVDISVAP
ncbi:acetyl-CoA carboxylase [Variovorax sp. HJSM1_2]|uniref:acetyl-CoA carboxylase n=1 Tax=Variovorax sp. HJSM1_2 TaxID=3366263 RepID=UPI003BE8A8C1